MAPSESHKIPVSPTNQTPQLQDIFNNPGPENIVHTRIDDWQLFIATPTLSAALVVRYVAIVRPYVNGVSASHEVLYIGVRNTCTNVSFLIISSRDAYPGEGEDSESRAFHRIDILQLLDQDHSQPIIICAQLTWTPGLLPSPPLLVDIVHLLYRTSLVLTNQDLPGRHDNHFVHVGFLAIQRHTGNPFPIVKFHKLFKFRDYEQCLDDVIETLRAFFRARSEQGRGKVKGKGEAQAQAEEGPVAHA